MTAPKVRQEETSTLRGMETVRVHRTEVLKKLRTNREGHRAVFEEALEGFHKAVVAALEQALKDAKAGKKYNPSVYLPEPQDHTRDYDRVIGLLEMSLDTELELTKLEFSTFVQDDWGWMGDFIGTTSNYTNR